MAKKSKKKGGVISTIGTMLVLLLVMIGLVTFFAVDANGGVSVTGTSIIFNKVNGAGVVYTGLASVFGGEAMAKTFTIINGQTGGFEGISVAQTLNANYGVIIGLIAFLIGAILLLISKGKKLVTLVGTLILIVGSVLLLCGGRFFSMANKDTIGGFGSGDYVSIVYMDLGALVCGVFGIAAGFIGFIKTIVAFVKK